VTQTPRYGLARVISKLGVCSRTQTAKLVAAGKVTANGRVITDAEHPTDIALDKIVNALRLVRLAIGPVQLGDLPKGSWRLLSKDELAWLEREQK
jgi:16S rRNA U516 pseudouridylate synthase RsuA-like enzyme